MQSFVVASPMTPEQTARELVDRFSWSSNVSRGGRLVGQQFVVAEAVADALHKERERCANIAHNMANALIAKRVTNKMDRHASDALVRCRDKIRAN